MNTAFFATYVHGEDVMRSSKGVPTNGVYGMTMMLRKLIQYSKASHLVVLWDINRDTFRRKIYPEYKANRKEQNVDLKEQYGVMQDLLKAMNIFQLGIDGYEADDLVGSLVERFKDSISITMVTKDRDYFQLLNSSTRLWLNTSTYEKLKESYYGTKKVEDLFKAPYRVPDNFFEYNVDNIEVLYGVRADQVVDYKSLEGDTSDNIPGVAGVGEKSIIPLLNEFGTLENIYDYIENNSEKDIKLFFKELGINRSPLNNLIKGKEEAFLSKELSMIKIDIPEIEERELDEFTLNIDKEGTRKKFEELEFKSLLK